MKKSYLYVSKGFEKILKPPVFDSILPAPWIWNMRKVSGAYRKSDDSQKEMDCVLLKNKTYPNMQEKWKESNQDKCYCADNKLG